MKEPTPSVQPDPVLASGIKSTRKLASGFELPRNFFRLYLSVLEAKQARPRERACRASVRWTL